MMTQAINGINGILTIIFLFNLIYKFSGQTYIEKDVSLTQFYWPQLIEVYYICGGINAYKLTRLPSKDAIHIIMRQYMTHFINSLTLWALQLSLSNDIKFSITGVVGFQNLINIINFNYVHFISVNNQYLFGQVVILIYKVFNQFRQQYCAIALIFLFIILRLHFALQITTGKLIYSQYTFLHQPIHELNAFFQAYIGGNIFNGRILSFRQNWLDISLSILLLVQQKMFSVIERIRRNLMDNQDWQIILIIIFTKYTLTTVYLIIILLLLSSNIANKLLNTSLIVFLGQNVISSYVSFIITQQVMELTLQDIKIGPFDKTLVNIIILGQLIFVLFISLLYSSLTKIIAIKLSYNIEQYIDDTFCVCCRLKKKYYHRVQVYR